MEDMTYDEFVNRLMQQLIRVLKNNSNHLCEKGNFKAYEDHTGFYLECSNATHSYFAAIKACPFCGYTPEKQ